LVALNPDADLRMTHAESARRWRRTTLQRINCELHMDNNHCI